MRILLQRKYPVGCKFNSVRFNNLFPKLMPIYFRLFVTSQRLHLPLTHFRSFAADGRADVFVLFPSALSALFRRARDFHVRQTLNDIIMIPLR